MFSNEIVNVSSRNLDETIHSIVPNFLFINKPVVKKVGNKIVKNKKLIIWFDIKNEYSRDFDLEKIKPEIILRNFKWQLVDTRNGTFKPVKLDDKKDKAEFDKLIIKRNTDRLVINPANTLTYELDADEYSNELEFKYSLTYENNQRLGITHLNNIGNNSGIIKINATNDQYTFNNAMAYLENEDDKSFILNQDKIKVKKHSLSRLTDVKEPIAEVSVDNKKTNVATIYKSEQLRGELERITQNEVNYLDTNEKGLKITNLGNSYKIYEEAGNHYDFQTNKWINDDKSESKYFDGNELKLSFTFNQQNISLNWNIEDNKTRLSNQKPVDKLTTYIHYKNIKQNTKFNTFMKTRETNLWK